MNRNLIAVILATGSVVSVACQQAQQQAAAPSPVERGKYLVTSMGCNDCHTPWKLGEKGPEPDMTRMLSGHPEGMKLPPSPALTPGPETGLGALSEENFIQAIRNGKHLGAGRDILPPMPWPMYRNLSDQDLKAIFAY